MGKGQLAGMPPVPDATGAMLGVEPCLKKGLGPEKVKDEFVPREKAEAGAEGGRAGGSPPVGAEAPRASRGAEPHIYKVPRLLHSIFSEQLWRAAGLEPKSLGTRRVVHLEEEAEKQRKQKEAAKKASAQRKLERLNKSKAAKQAREALALNPKNRKHVIVSRYERAVREAERAEREKAEEGFVAGDREAWGRKCVECLKEVEEGAEGVATCSGCLRLAHAECTRQPWGEGERFRCDSCRKGGAGPSNETAKARPQRAAAPAAGSLRDKHNVPYSAILPGALSRPKVKDSPSRKQLASEDGVPGTSKAMPAPKPASPSKSDGRDSGQPGTPERELSAPAQGSPDRLADLNDEQLAMLLHQELNAPPPRRRARDSSIAAGSPKLAPPKRKRELSPHRSPDTPLCPPLFSKTQEAA